MYKNNVPLPDVSVEPPFGPQINTSSEMGCCRGECEWRLGWTVSGCLVCWVHYSAHEEDGS